MLNWSCGAFKQGLNAPFMMTGSSELGLHHFVVSTRVTENFLWQHFNLHPTMLLVQQVDTCPTFCGGQEQLVQGPDSNHNLSASTSTQGQQFSALLPELWALLAKTAHLTFSNVWSKWLRRFALCYFAVGWVCKGTLC